MKVETLITKLNVELLEKQEEIVRLNNIIEKNKYTTDELNYIEELENRINKAVEYVKDNIGKSNNELYFELVEEEIEEFLQILKGQGNENTK